MSGYCSAIGKMSVSIFLSETVAVKSSLKLNGQCRRRAAGGCRRVESQYNKPLISTKREHRRRAPCIHGGILKHTCKHANTHTHIHAKPAPTDHDPAVQTGLITSYPPLPTTTTRVLTTQWVDAQPRGAMC